MNTISDVIIFVILISIVLAIPAQAIIRTQKRSVKKWRHCIECGYDRRGIEANAPCPECGSVPGITGLARTKKQAEVSCRACNQSLKGMDWNTTCPECGLPSAALPKFYRQKRTSVFSPLRLLDSALLGIWVLALLVVTLLIINIF